MYEDGWIAHYAAACFIDDSLLWYMDLDEDTCNSWRKLRRALVQQYGIGTRNVEPPSTGPARGPQDLVTPRPPVGGPTTWTTPSAPNIPRERRGKIEVFLYNYPKTVGFLAYDAALSNFSIVPNADRAQVVSFLQNIRDSPFSIRMEGLPAHTQYPHVGLVLVNDGSNPLQTVPPVFLTGSSIPNYRRIARAIGPQDRASAAVWTYDENTNRLSMVWMTDDDAEVELAAIVRNDEQASLQINQISEWKIAPYFDKEFRVKLLFVPEESD
ncbi:hypothetical protein FRC04_004950 [Tulasnella sp. 424]|nr:hypothetical protein FRC04_004950 [Tulasnella sp. 424]KAG8970186.1 hypothetical protein FRC05_000707 [Tulasnella sp. 425]